MGYLKKYIPGILTRKDYKLQKSMLNRSVKNYKKGKYYTRIPVNSFTPLHI
jgi:capsule polysaccharide modification protein KpsS